MFGLIGAIPNAGVRMYVNDKMFKVAFRLMCRSLSAVVTYHNLQYRPRNKGFCVANHTSPMDVGILGADCTFSLVRRKLNTKPKQSSISAHLFFVLLIGGEGFNISNNLYMYIYIYVLGTKELAGK